MSPIASYALAEPTQSPLGLLAAVRRGPASTDRGYESASRRGVLDNQGVSNSDDQPSEGHREPTSAWCVECVDPREDMYVDRLVVG